MNLNKLVFVATLYPYYILVSLSHRHVDANGGDTPAAAMYYLSDVAINCGTLGNSTALDGRDWIGETASKFLSSLQPKGKSRSSTVVHKFNSADSVPYMTARISATPFHYRFRVNPGQKFIRLHFYPASYRGFEKSLDFFTVKAGPFTLLKDFSASVDADASGAKYLVKEFCLNVDENVELKITFSPSQGNTIYAFVNGIEIISMPAGLYYTPPGDLGAPVVGLNNQLYVIDKSTALEAIQRLNIGGSSISSVEDFGMFRRWNEDTNYLLESKVHRVKHLVLKMKYVPAFIAPPKLYQTSWKTGRNVGVNQIYRFTWKIPIYLGFAYLIRLHFCELDGWMTESGQREFSVLINNEIAESRANVIRWSSGAGMPVYKDYVVIMKADKESSKCDLLIILQSVDQLVLGLLNGLEIFKLSNLENSFAASIPSFPERLSTSWNLKNQKVFIGFGQSNFIVTGMTILIILVNIVVYNLRQIWEDKFNLGTGTRTSRTEPSYHRFSLVEIKSATQNFSDAFVIGRGGFGKVYKGFIPSISEIVAIKRLNFYSRQGAHEFWTEIETLSRLRHVHLVSLLGYCNEDQEMILVYEYMPCGTLADNLYKLSRKGKDIDPLSWEQRLRICIGVARGLEYLHTGTECAVIHRDVKDSNILLDENFVAKISDFGLSKLEKRTQSKSYVSTNVKGTPAYLDPEYVMTGRLTRKSDVYAFGVVLLVVLSGRPAIDTKSQEHQSLLSCFRECITEEDVDRIVDPSLQGKIPPKSLIEFLKFVENCLHHMPKKRPTMAQVVASLEQTLEQPKSPAFSASTNSTVNGREEVPILGENVIPALGEGITSNKTQNSPTRGNDLPVFGENVISSLEEGITSNPTQYPYSRTRGNDLQPRRKDHARVPKPSWNWPWKANWNRGKKQKAEVSLLESMPEVVQLYSYKTLADATNGFQPGSAIDKRGFNEVYKGILSTGQAIEVKMRSSNPYQGSVEFMNEVVVLSKLQHPNVVRLLGCCVERKRKMLIYGYMPNRSLHTYLFEKRCMLDWNKRAIIIEGIGRGLLYLHQDSELNIIHGNLEASNILLDEELKPKISDCELARTLGSQYESQTIRVGGTWGYTAPDYALEGRFSDKSDVYSYGVLLLEIVSGNTNPSTYGPNLIERAWKLWNANITMELVDSALPSPPSETEISRYVQVGLLCVQFWSRDRPNISTVLSMLSGEVDYLPWPKSPFYVAGRDLSVIKNLNAARQGSLMLSGEIDDLTQPKSPFYVAGRDLSVIKNLNAARQGSLDTYMWGDYSVNEFSLTEVEGR